MTIRVSDSELGIQNVSDNEAFAPIGKDQDHWNPFEAHRCGPSGFDESEYKGLREIGYDRQIASRAILGLGGQVIDFDYLYQLDLVHLQKQLARDYTKICTDGVASGFLLKEMHEHLIAYSMTLQHYENMLARPQRRVPPNWNLLDVFFPELGLKRFTQKSGYPSAMHWMKSRSIRGYTGYTDYTDKQEDVILHLKQVKRQRIQIYSEKINRFLVALFGGVAVVVPILIMSFNSSQGKSLTTVSVSVLLVSLIIAILSKASYQELITATAAYAAILVVFIGTDVGSVG